MIYGIFHAELGSDMYLDSKTCNPRGRLVEMYHARVDEENKEQILKLFSELDGCVRVNNIAINSYHCIWYGHRL
jgi:hypothetical protein